MKICFIAPANSIHITKMCKWFAMHGHTIDIVSFENATHANPYATIHTIPVELDPTTASNWTKLQYLFHGKIIRKIVEKINADVINVHYASSYGSAAALAGIGKYILSVWGSDIFSFPNHSLLHRQLIKFSLQHAERIFSTSNVMAKETRKYTDKLIIITPFGVDTSIFHPFKRKPRTEFVVGTVKTLTHEYGIGYLLQAAAILRKSHPEIPLRLRIAGAGKDELELKSLSKQLNLDKITTWLGFLSQEQVAFEWGNFDVAVIVSNFESFGVTAIEAQACATPLIVSDAPGLLETTRPEVSSLVIPRKDPNALANALIELYQNESLRKKMGEEGVHFVSKKYEINHCFKHMEKQFAHFLSNS